MCSISRHSVSNWHLLNVSTLRHVMPLYIIQNFQIQLSKLVQFICCCNVVVNNMSHGQSYCNCMYHLQFKNNCKCTDNILERFWPYCLWNRDSKSEIRILIKLFREWNTNLCNNTNDFPKACLWGSVLRSIIWLCINLI